MVVFRAMKTDIPSGTLYMLVLKTLARLGPMHGYGIALYIQQTTGDVLHVEEGTLYPALQRMLIKSWVERGVAHDREQAPSALLHADTGGTEAACRPRCAISSGR